MSDDLTIHLLDDILVELRAIRHLLETERDRDAALLAVVTTSIPEQQVFSASDLWQHATVNDDLKAAFERAGLEDARALALALRRLRGHVSRGVRLERVVKTASGVLWALRTDGRA